MCAELAFWECHPSFQLRRLLLGPKGMNLHFISDQTGAAIQCRGSPLKLIVSADREDKLDTAMRMARDLIGTMRAAYDRWLVEGGVASSTTPVTRPPAQPSEKGHAVREVSKTVLATPASDGKSEACRQAEWQRQQLRPRRPKGSWPARGGR